MFWFIKDWEGTLGKFFGTDVLSILPLFAAQNEDIGEVTVTEQVFRWQMNEDQMATDKLSEGIRKFAADSIKLENVLKERL